MSDFSQTVLQSEAGKIYLYSVGQAGFILKNKKAQLLAIDLYLSDCVEKLEGHMGFKRLLPSILKPHELQFDGMIATHPHLDHFDKDSVFQMLSNGKTQLYASLNCRKNVEQAYIDEKNVVYVKSGDKYELGDYILEFVPCDHGSEVPDAVGVIITVDGKKIYITGDTCLRLDMLDELKEKGDFDLLIAPINGAYGNLNEEECARLSSSLNPGLTIPCHYGMFAAHGGNPGAFIEKMKEICPKNRYYLMTLGEGLII